MPITSSGELHFAIVGPGRAGRSFQAALTSAGATCDDVIGRSDDPRRLDAALDLVLITVPDHTIADVASGIPQGPLVVHVSGATTLAPLLTHHARSGSIHPLMSLPNAAAGAEALLDHANLAVAGADEASLAEVTAIAERLGANAFTVADERRGQYHAAAAIAANHLAALTAQVERVAEHADVPVGPFLDMMRTVLYNVEATGAVAALTGPAARGDWGTITAHLDALHEEERQLYTTLARECATLAGRDLPPQLRAANEPTTPAEDQA